MLTVILFHRCGGMAEVDSLAMGGGAGGLRGLAGRAFGLLATAAVAVCTECRGGAAKVLNRSLNAGGLRHFILPLVTRWW